jgi:DNA-binding IclR family transcriptional regulator
MVSSALSANRALAALDWVVGHPGESFTLSELSRAIGVNVPSLMSVLKSLTDAGYLVRHPAGQKLRTRAGSAGGGPRNQRSTSGVRAPR